MLPSGLLASTLVFANSKVSHLKMSGSTGDVLQQVNQFWSILDDLSQNDPAAYRELIEKQMKEGAGFSAPPELDSCIRTEMLVSCVVCITLKMNGH